MALVASLMKMGGRFGFTRVSQAHRNWTQFKSTGTTSSAPPPKDGPESKKTSKSGSSQARSMATSNRGDPFSNRMKQQTIQEQVARMSMDQPQQPPANYAQQQAAACPPGQTPAKGEDVYFLPHKCWNFGQMQGISATHHTPDSATDKAAFQMAQFFRGVLDNLAGYEPGPTERRAKKPELMWPKRFLMLECLSSTTPTVAARIQHMKSIFNNEIDNGWIRAMTCEADNERIHLLTALKVCCASKATICGIVALQALSYPGTWVIYAMCPKFCHRVSGYMQEEAIKIYSQCLEDIEEGSMKAWRTQPAPAVAKRYWCLKEDATVYDVIMSIRADKDRHRAVNHILACTAIVENLDPYRLPQ